MKTNIRIYGDHNEQTELALNLCEMGGISPVVMYVGEDYKEETAIAIVDANYVEPPYYPLIFDGLTFLGGVAELRRYLKGTV